jgi:4-hydroxy-2-oxoheptanedioate aldolase
VSHGDQAPIERAATTSLRHRLHARDFIIGTFSILPCPEIIELVALAGFDAVVIDMEHGPYTTHDAYLSMLAAERHGMATMVRVPAPDSPSIGVLLDLGVEAVIVPHVDDAAVAAQIVRACRFYPDGERGAHPWVRSAGHAAPADFYRQQNERVAVIAMIEGAGGVRNFDEIIRTPGLDAVFVGPVDLSHSLGVPGQLSHPSVTSTIESLIERADAENVALSIFCGSPEQAMFWRERGVRFVVSGVDANLVHDAFSRNVGLIRNQLSTGHDAVDAEQSVGR